MVTADLLIAAIYGHHSITYMQNGNCPSIIRRSRTGVKHVCCLLGFSDVEQLLSFLSSEAHRNAAHTQGRRAIVMFRGDFNVV